MSITLAVKEPLLPQHFASVEGILRNHVDGGSDAKLRTSPTKPPLVAGLVGTEGEYAERSRGPRTPVARTIPLGNDLWAWISYREAWDSARHAGKIKRFSFRSAGLTIYFGYRYNLFKPQMFRAEWTTEGASEQSGDQSANPHWHFDALESLKRDDAEQRAANIRTNLRKKEGENVPRSFSRQMVPNDVHDVVSVQKLSKLHFASAACWWTNNAAPHVHGPGEVRDIQAWVKGTLEHLASELRRLGTSR